MVERVSKARIVNWLGAFVVASVLAAAPVVASDARGKPKEHPVITQLNAVLS